MVLGTGGAISDVEVAEEDIPAGMSGTLDRFEWAEETGVPVHPYLREHPFIG